MAPLHKYPFQIETPEAELFWASRHKCNRAKAIIAFSDTEKQALSLMRRVEGWNYHLRAKALRKYRIYVHNPSMILIPFSVPSTITWQEEMSGAPDAWPYTSPDLSWMEGDK